MISGVLSTATGFLCILCCGVWLNAQVPNYHVELTDGTSGYVILVNASAKTIEAFHLTTTCGNSAGSPYYDKLSKSDTSGPPVIDHDGRWVGPLQSQVIAPGQRLQTAIRLAPYPNGCSWNADVDGVIYSDGTYEGSDEGVRSLQGWRDGLADELQYWSTKLQQETPADPYAIAKEAKQRAETYMHQPYRGPIHSLRYYRYGEEVVASTLAIKANGNPSPEKLHRREIDLIDQWQKKLDDDVAFKKLNAIFPLPVEATTTSPPRPTDSVQP